MTNNRSNLGALTAQLQLKRGSWDYIIETDGSGTSYNASAGWAAVLHKPGLERALTLSGAFSSGTNNVAELMAVWQALLYLVEAEAVAETPEAGCRVHVVSDSRYVVEGLNRLDTEWASDITKNRMLWLGVAAARRLGVIITAHHVLRDTTEGNRWCHEQANSVRRLLAPPDTGSAQEKSEEQPSMDMRRALATIEQTLQIIEEGADLAKRRSDFLNFFMDVRRKLRDLSKTIEKAARVSPQQVRKISSWRKGLRWRLEKLSEEQGD